MRRWSSFQSFNITSIRNWSSGEPSNTTVHVDIKSTRASIFIIDTSTNYAPQQVQFTKIRVTGDTYFLNVEVFLEVPNGTAIIGDDTNQFNFMLYDFFVNELYEERENTEKIFNEIETADCNISSSISIIPEEPIDGSSIIESKDLVYRTISRTFTKYIYIPSGGCDLRLYDWEQYNKTVLIQGLSSLRDDGVFLSVLFKQNGGTSVGYMRDFGGKFYGTIDFGPEDDYGAVVFKNCPGPCGLTIMSPWEISYEILPRTTPSTT